MKKRFTEAQIIGFLREAEVGLPVKDLYPPARVLRWPVTTSGGASSAG